MATSSTVAESDAQGERGDLISFYNTVYVQAMRSFALQFSNASLQTADHTLSPLPLLTNVSLVSPKCKITNNIFITPYDTPNSSLSRGGKVLEYRFSRSPSKVRLTTTTTTKKNEWFCPAFWQEFRHCCCIKMSTNLLKKSNHTNVSDLKKKKTIF